MAGRCSWRPALPDDLGPLRATCQAAQLGQLDDPGWERLPGAAELLEAQFRTFCVHGEPAALFGVVLLWPGVADGLGLLSEAALRSPLSLTRGARAGIAEAFEKLALRRLQITVAEKHRAAHVWARALGFVPEGRMACYGPEGGHYWRYARIVGG